MGSWSGCSFRLRRDLVILAATCGRRDGLVVLGDAVLPTCDFEVGVGTGLAAEPAMDLLPCCGRRGVEVGVGAADFCLCGDMAVSFLLAMTASFEPLIAQ